MSIAHKVADILREHVTLEVEGIDRMYLNVYVPQLQRELGVVSFFRFHRGNTFASSALMDPITKAFIDAVGKFAARNHIDVINFAKGQRKDDILKERLKTFTGVDRVVFIGKAQEKASVFRTEKRHDEQGRSYPWIVRSSALVNQVYFYCMDKDFGPFFLKFCTYFPYNAKLCINGHEYVKRQLAKEGIAFEALDNGILTCANPIRLQQLCDELEADKIDALLRKWLAILPHPFNAEDRRAGYRYQLSILQAEFSLTQVLDRPVTGRVFFEEVLRENLAIGRPDAIQLIFGRRITKRTPGRFRTRVLTEGVIPSLHVDYKNTRIKQYHKEGRALRTETTINNTRDFAIGKGLSNLPALREIGFRANRRLLDVQRISSDCAIGEKAFQALQQTKRDGEMRIPALRFGDVRVEALLCALVVLRLLPNGFSNRELRNHVAPLLGQSPEQFTPGKMTYDLRRLRLRGLIERIPKSHRYRITDTGLRTALFYSRVYARIIRPGLSELMRPESDPRYDSKLGAAFKKVEHEIGRLCKDFEVAA